MNILKLFVILVSLVFTSICYSQSGWFCTYPFPTSSTLYSACAINVTTVILVGKNGTILISTNSGSDWVEKGNFYSDELRKCQFLNQETGFIGGTDRSINKAVIYKTTNQGMNWNRMIIQEMPQINCIYFSDLNTGYACGINSELFKTTNGGISWSYKENQLNISFERMYFSNSQTGYISGYKNDSVKVFKTTNGGINWVLLYKNGWTDLYDMYFIDSLTGYFSGLTGISPPFYNPVLYKTTNGGANWIYLSHGHYQYALYFNNTGTGYSGGSNFISKTTNSGTNWSIISTPGAVSYSIAFLDNITGFAVGFEGSALKTTNGGSNWIILGDSVSENIKRIKFAEDNFGYAVSSSKILKTTNSGNRWITNFNSVGLSDLEVINKDIVFTCGSQGIFKTNDGGNTWTRQDTLSTIAISFLNSETGYCSGNNVLLKTINGGVTWMPIIVNFNAWGSGNISVVDSNVIYINSLNKLYKSTNGGNNWLGLDSNLLKHGNYFINAGTGFVFGHNHSIYKTTDGGNTWINKYYNAGSGYLNSVIFVDYSLGFGCGDFGKLLKTVNGGENWFEVFSPTQGNINTIYTKDSNIIHIGGTSFIFKTRNGVSPIGIISNSFMYSDLFLLTQNYPNPFNPQTKIKFAVPKTSFTKIIVYDLLGREVAILVNEELRPGTYEADWDGTDFSSGVYFFKIITEGFVETKKMVLMK